MLHIDFRPKKWKDVKGQGAIVKSLKGLLKGGEPPHAFLFLGPSGCGKTTIARILAKKLKCVEPTEVDAATFTGIDDWRAIKANLSYKPLQGETTVIIVDECQSLSPKAWQSLLKDLEDCPAHVYWCLCTTEANKVIKTVRTRCTEYTVQLLKDDDIGDLIDEVCAAESIELPDKAVNDLIEYAAGSARQALTGLNAIRSATTREEVEQLLKAGVGEDKEIIEICRGLVKRDLSWAKAMQIIGGLKNKDPESHRYVVQGYFLKVCLGSKRAGDAQRALQILEAFNEPYHTRVNLAPFLLSLGELILETED